MWKSSGRDHAQLGRAKRQRRGEASEAVNNAAPEIDRRALGGVRRWAADLADRVAEPDDLRQHLIVEHKIIGIGIERQLHQQGRGKRPIAGVVFREFHVDQRVLRRGQPTVEKIFVQSRWNDTKQLNYKLMINNVLQ